jgi:hypothetical protein
MRPTRGITLAALVLVAVIAPASAFALTAGDDPGTPPTAAAHPGADDQADDLGDDDATEPADSDSDAAEGTGGTGQAAAASAAGRAHAAAMKAWAHCVAEAASGPKTGERTGPPKLACGEKPVGPGRAAHAPDAAGNPPAGRSGVAPGKSHGHGKAGAHRH